ncbi:hemolytic lectin-S1 [Paramuricea clavata]|uniref:Hemolytic lectin-S1 n=1 Tax=Paramuricea clavata TaxID=317549 RepID=A0A6S7HJI5_PARCT|nr:hemolytic lectin-S1 [Paramuricea clavata]
MSNIVVLIVIVLTCISTETAAQVGCVNPMKMSELRVLKSKKCINIAGTAGCGKIDTNLCDGYHDQQIIMCEDGTMRNLKASHNCFTPGKNGKGNLKSTSCEVYPAIPDYQKWRYGRSKTFVDTGGIKQEAREIINVKSGACMNVHGRGGNGDISASRCENLDDQYFYFRSRGKLLGHGRLQVTKSGLCLDVKGDQGRGNVLIYNCEDAADQLFYFHENGELVNKKSGLCVNIGGYSGYGDISMYACQDLPDQMWTRPHQYCVGDYCSFRSKKAAQCIDVSGSSASKGCNVLTHKCDGAPDQRFKWLKGNWVTPSATWSMVGCNQNGKVTHAISNTIKYTTKISSSISISVSSTIEAGFLFGSASVTREVSISLAKEWENSQSGTRKITFTCQNYDTGKPFIRGCMWQFQLTTKETTKNDILTWSPRIVKCTSNHQVPKCPPFTRCKDDACTMCEKLPGARKKKSVDESLTWKKY